MTVDDANTALATASTREQRAAACRQLAAAACAEIAVLEFDYDANENEGYALITRLIEARNVLTMAAQHIEENTRGQNHGMLRYQHAAIDELDAAQVHITLAIEAL